MFIFIFDYINSNISPYIRYWIDNGYLPDPSMEQVWLYNYGEEFYNITGGWSCSSTTVSHEKTTSCMHIYSGLGARGGHFDAANLIDFTKMTKLKITYTLRADDDRYTGIYIDGSLKYIIPVQSTAEEYVINVSGLSGEHAFGVGYLIGGSASGQSNTDMKIYKVELSA